MMRTDSGGCLKSISFGHLCLSVQKDKQMLITRLSVDVSLAGKVPSPCSFSMSKEYIMLRDVSSVEITRSCQSLSLSSKIRNGSIN